MDLLSSLGSNPGLAGALAQAEAEEGGWEALFDSLEALEEVEAADIRAAAGTYLSHQRTVGYLLPPGARPSTPVGEDSCGDFCLDFWFVSWQPVLAAHPG